MDESYLIFLVLGALLVFIDGQIILRSGRAYLAQGNRDPEAAASMARLTAVLFHLVMLGVLGILSTIDPGVDDPAQNVVTKLGIVLLLLGLAHAATMTVLSRIRARQSAQRLADEIAERQEEQAAQFQPRPTIGPTGEVPAPRPTVSPTLEQQNLQR